MTLLQALRKAKCKSINNNYFKDSEENPMYHV
jgi:hypothetical protein